MHRTQGDSFGTFTSGHGVPVNCYRDENPGNWDATQGRHQEMNAIQEEIAYVIEDESITLNTDSETPATMTQLRDALDARHKASRVDNDSTVAGTHVDDALDNLESYIAALSMAIANLGSDDIANDSSLSGTTVTDVLDDLDDSDIINNSAFEGDDVYDVLENLYNQRRRFIRGCSYGNDSSNRNEFIFTDGYAADTTGQYIMRIPYQSGGYRKHIENTTGWAAGHNGNGLPAAVTCAVGTRLYIFLIRRLNETIDIGFDTDINAANLYADGTCQARRWRRIGYCQIESLDGNECDAWICTFKNGWHYVGSGNGYARGIPYDITMTAAFEYLVGNNQYLPNFDCIAIFRPLPPSGAADVNCTMLPRYMSSALSDFQAEYYYNSFILTTAGADVIRSTGGVEMMPAYMADPENGFIIGCDVWSGVTTHFRIMGFYDFRDQTVTS